MIDPGQRQLRPQLAADTGSSPLLSRLRSNRPLAIALAAVLGVLVLCCCGLGIRSAATSFRPAPTQSLQPGLTTRASSSPTPTLNASTAPAPVPSLSPAPTPPPARSPAPAPTIPPVTQPTTGAPAPAPTTEAPPPRQGVTPGAFCSPQGGFGYTSSGTLMQCKTSATDSRARWRAA